jgi:pimeloyl-ACP methyl ester carboxylesterase
VLAVHSSPDGVAREHTLPSPVGSRIVLWEGSGHYLHLQHPLRFADLVVNWAANTTADVDAPRV